MTVEQQLDLNVKMRKLFDTCKLDDMWRHKKNSESPHDYVAIREGAKIVLILDNSGLIETFKFKKGALISLKNSIVEYYETDLFR